MNLSGKRDTAIYKDLFDNSLSIMIVENNSYIGIQIFENKSIPSPVIHLTKEQCLSLAKYLLSVDVETP